MKKENPVSYRLKIRTITIIEEIYTSGEATTYKEACNIFLCKVKRKKIATGFSEKTLKNNEQFYNLYRVYKHKLT